MQADASAAARSQAAADAAEERAALLEAALEEKEGLLASLQLSQDALARRCHAVQADAVHIGDERAQLHTQLGEAHAAYAALHDAAAGRLHDAAVALEGHRDASGAALGALSATLESLAALRADAERAVHDWTSAAVGLCTGLRELADSKFGSECGGGAARGGPEQLSAAAAGLLQEVETAVAAAAAAADGVAAQQAQLQVWDASCAPRIIAMLVI